MQKTKEDKSVVKNIKKNKNSDKKENNNKNNILEKLEERFFEFISFLFKKGFLKMFFNKIDDIENSIKDKVEEKFDFYKNKIIFLILILISFIFLVYGAFENILIYFNMENFTNTFFGIFLLIISLFFYNRK